MAEDFYWIRPGYELVTFRLQWNTRVPFLETKTKDDIANPLVSPLFYSQETPDRKWQLEVIVSNTQIGIYAHQCDGERRVKFVEPVLVEMSILNRRGKKFFQEMLRSYKHLNFVYFSITKDDIITSECQQPDGSLTLYWKIFTHVKKVVPVSSVDPPVNFTGGHHLEELLNNLHLSDVNFNVYGREIPAHKNILCARSQFFEAIFQHPTKENLTNQIEIEDTEPDVFEQLLRFIYTGKVSPDKLETMAARLFIAADKYLVDELKMKCENHLLCNMSPDISIEILLNSNLLNLSEQLKKEAAQFFCRFPLQVMATSQWEKVKQENPVALVDILKIVYSHKQYLSM